MPFTNFPYGVTSFGAPMIPGGSGVQYPVGFLGAGSTSQPGSNVFFVNSSVLLAFDAAGSNGLSPATPFKTLNYAISQCVNNNGDVIYVGPGHVETVTTAGGLAFAKAGVTVIGIGNHVDRPRIVYSSSTAATVSIAAANVKLMNFRVLNSIDARVDGFIISGADCELDNIEFADSTGTSSLISLRTTNTAARLRLNKIRCYFSENTGSARTEFIRIVGGTDHEYHDIYNDQNATFSTAVFNNVTTVTGGFEMTNVDLFNGTTAPAAVFVGGSIGSFKLCNFYTAAGVSAVTLPTSYAIDNTSTVSNGTYSGPANSGARYTFQKSFTSSALTTSPQTFITCTGGSVTIDAVTVETDGTGLAGGTNHQLLTNNVNGLALLAAETVANLGANKTVDLTAASVTALRKGFVLESGKVLQLDNTVGAGTGAGKIFYNVVGQVLTGAPVLS